LKNKDYKRTEDTYRRYFREYIFFAELDMASLPKINDNCSRVKM